MTERNWVAPKGCSYVIDTNAPSCKLDLKHYGGHLVAESIFDKDEMALILAAPAQAKQIVKLEEQVASLLRQLNFEADRSEEDKYT